MININRICLRDPIPEIYDALRLLDAAVTLHLLGKYALAESLFKLADDPAISAYSESLWGAGGPWTKPLPVPGERLPHLPREHRVRIRLSPGQKATLLARDGYHCRFCGIGLVLPETRILISQSYPEAVRWGTRNSDQHAGFQAIELQYDHIIPHARGGTNEIDNMVVACAPCNCGRSSLTLDEVGISDPRLREPARTHWDGLRRFIGRSN